MLKYKLSKTEGDLIEYSYYLSRGGALGLVSINKETGETNVVKPSEDDFWLQTRV